ncbi:hypothetical protein [Nonomuraea zeae]|uniref:Uncharacterized protein n=1 Tax=Nonomuraea zeae TaxID=1642303 RepID=A0A5S4HJ52_9ACTN|nr:hypothetical protein [Nonomuraea zeae]TMR39080.1 hypothetical protein ETD85_03095 [Nonomuraea zeae]
MATLTAGVSWLTAGPSMADACANSEPALLSTSSFAAYCDEQTRVRINDGGNASSRMVTEESNKMAMAAGSLARQLGLTGLATGKSALGTADLGGIAATWGMPSLSSGAPALFPAVPGLIGMEDLATMAGIPALPALPQRPLQSKAPGKKSLPPGPHDNRIAGTGIQSPLDLQEPVYEVGADVIGVLLPKAVESVEGTSMLPGGQPVVDGFTGLAQGLGLR